MLLLSTAVLVGACATRGGDGELVTGDGYRHWVAASPGASASTTASAHLVLFIGGDGRAFVSRQRVARDPTSWRDPMLTLARLEDAGHGAYLGRPCYHGLAEDVGCDPRAWTSQRYSVDKSTSMVAAKRSVWSNRPTLLVAYSGGAALAMQMARRMPETTGLVTLAGNLDPAAWTRHHAYTPLEAAPQAPRLPGHLRQLHVLAGRDTNIPPALTRAIPTLPADSLCEVAALEHAGPWTSLWQQLRPQLSAWLAGETDTRTLCALLQS